MATTEMNYFSGGGGGLVAPEVTQINVPATEATFTLPHAPVSMIMLENTNTTYPKAGTCRYDVANADFLVAPTMGEWLTFTVSGDQLTLLGDSSARSFTYNVTVC